MLVSSIQFDSIQNNNPSENIDVMIMPFSPSGGRNPQQLKKNVM